MRPEHTHGLSTLHEKRFVIVETAERTDDPLVAGPVAGRLSPPPYTIRSSGRSATAGSRLFISILSAAS